MDEKKRENMSKNLLQIFNKFKFFCGISFVNNKKLSFVNYVKQKK